MLSELPPPWTEALKESRVGDTIRIWYEAEPGALYVADVELLYAYSVHDAVPAAHKRSSQR